ncbi:hypothetical protein ANN_19151 [Periplaneta americana]|uniref:Uncharacterized protein n=1 Tax=Periplaneta americana TaxID=6978 RepID=A0ABQ8S9C3_PERAM|nr:hypothetical protein ANN_19151 [Periplaneta americana]
MERRCGRKPYDSPETTISFDASCIIACIQPINITIDGNIQLYKATHGAEIMHTLEPVNWNHPAQDNLS